MKRLALAIMLAFASARVAHAEAPTPTADVLVLVRAEAATLLGKRPADIEVARPLSQLGADELDLVELIMALEEKFDISIPDDALEAEAETWSTLSVQDLARIVQRLRSGSLPGAQRN